MVEIFGEARFLLPAIMVLWANLHGGFLIGLIIVGIFCGVALLRRDWVNFKIYGFVGVGWFGSIFRQNPSTSTLYRGGEYARACPKSGPKRFRGYRSSASLYRR